MNAAGSAWAPSPASATAGRAEAASDSTFDAGSRAEDSPRWIGWRRRGLVVAVLLGCMAVFAAARWLAAMPTLPASFAASSTGQLRLVASTAPSLAGAVGQDLKQLQVGAAAPVTLDAAVLHRAPRWQVDDGQRQRQILQQQAVQAALSAASGAAVALQAADGQIYRVSTLPRNYAGLGLLFWPLMGAALLVYLFGAVLLLARPVRSSVLYAVMCGCVALQLGFVAIESAPGLGGPASGPVFGDLGLRVALDLCFGAAVVHALLLQAANQREARWLPLAGWAAPLGWLALNGGELLGLGSGGPGWAVAQGLCLLQGLLAWALVTQSHRAEPNPYTAVIWRLVTGGVLGFMAATALLVWTRSPNFASASWAQGVSVLWYGLLAASLLLTPALARTRRVLHEFALLAGVSTVATALDLLFVAAFSLGSYTSLAMAVFIALALYAGLRQWVLGRLLGRNQLTMERSFELLYRAAREVQMRPERYTLAAGTLLRDLFEPLELKRADKVPSRARVIGGGAVLVVPVRSSDDEGAPSMALALRYALRGQRLFTEEDARLAQRIVEQLRRAVAYDQAVERGRSEERKRIAQDLHDDIGARLLTLMYQSPTREMEDYLRHTLQDLKTLTRGLAASEQRLSDAAAEWKADLTQRLNAAHATLVWSFSVDEDLRLSVVQWSGLTRVLRELVSNALYHGHASRVDVQFKLEGGQLNLRVFDDGDGANPETWSHGLGLGGVRKRVKLMGGKVAWRENAPRGVLCEVQVDAFSPAQGT